MIRPPRLFRFLHFVFIETLVSAETFVYNFNLLARISCFTSPHIRLTQITDYRDFSFNDAVDTQMLDNTSAPPNQEAFDENRNLPSTTKIDTTDAPAPEVNPGGPTPTDDTSSGIAPVAGYIPKDAPNLSHPTPPPDQPLASGEANVDTEMLDQSQPTEQDSKPEPVSEQVASAESIQQDEPMMADSKPEESKPEESLLNGLSKSTEPPSDVDAEPSVDAKPEPAPIESTQESVQSAQSGLVRPREDDEDDDCLSQKPYASTIVLPYHCDDNRNPALYSIHVT